MEEFSLLDQLETHLITKRVGIQEFAESEKFCNKVLYPKQRLLLKLIYLEDRTDMEERWLDEWIESPEVTIPHDIRERIQYCKDHGYPHFREVVFVGGRRSSKGFLTGLVLAKKMYDTLQLQDPQRHYGIDEGKEIYFTCVAASEKQAKELQYSDFSNTVNSCSAMRPYFAKSQELEFSLYTDYDRRIREGFARQGRRVQRDTSTLRGRALASNSRTIRGYTSMGIVFDEMAFFMQGESDQADEAVYEAAIPSLAQFKQDGIIFCNSSPATKVGKFYERFEVSQATDSDTWTPTTLGIRFPSWALYQDWWEDPNYVGPAKCVQVSPDWNIDRKDKNGYPFYVKDDRVAIEQERLRERDNPEKYKVERRGVWAEVVDAYLLPEMVDRMFFGRPKLSGEEFEPYPTNWNDSTYMHRYKAHVDPSSTTAGFGFALGHTEHLKVLNHEGIEVETEHVVFDIIKRWDPHSFPDGVIDWQFVTQEILQYCDIFRPYEVTFDQFQSAAMIQELARELRKRGMAGTRVYEKTATAQHNYDRAEVFKTALYQGLVHAPNDTADLVGEQGVQNELKYLQEIRTGRLPRIDKQDVGPVTTKDMADCVMEVVEGLIGNMILAQGAGVAVSPSYGAPNGYPIGGHDAGGYGGQGSPFADLYTRRIGEQATRGTAMSGEGRLGRGGRGGPGMRNPARGRGISR